jgi:hypothetical protein
MLDIRRSLNLLCIRVASNYESMRPNQFCPQLLVWVLNHARQHSRTMIRVRQTRMVVDLQHANIPQYRTEGSEISMSTSFT